MSNEHENNEEFDYEDTIQDMKNMLGRVAAHKWGPAFAEAMAASSKLLRDVCDGVWDITFTPGAKEALLEPGDDRPDTVGGFVGLLVADGRHFEAGTFLGAAVQVLCGGAADTLKRAVNDIGEPPPDSENRA